MTPKEHYAFYLSIVWDLDTRHPMIHNNFHNTSVQESWSRM